MSALARLLTPYVLAGVRRRQALTIAALLGLAQYFVLVYTPAQLRTLAIDADAPVRALALSLAFVVWMRSSRVFAWRLVLALDVRFLRHLPIAANQWRRAHALQLVVLDLLLSATAAYGLLPTFARDRGAAMTWWLASVLGALAWRVGQCAFADAPAIVRGVHAIGAALVLGGVIVLNSPALALAIAGLAATWAVWRLGFAFAEPRGSATWSLPWSSRSPIVALARLFVGLAWQLERAFVSIALVTQAGAMALGALACVRVGVDDPDGAIAGVRLFACAAAGMAIWSALRVERRIAIDRWALDPLVASPRLEIGARMIAAAAHAMPLVLTGIALATVVLGGRFAIEMVVVALAAAVWVAATTVGIAIASTRSDRMHEPRIFAQLWRLLVVGTLTVLDGALVLVLFAAIEIAFAWSRWPAAERMRQRRGRIVGEAERDG